MDGFSKKRAVTYHWQSGLHSLINGEVWQNILISYKENVDKQGKRKTQVHNSTNRFDYTWSLVFYFVLP